MFPIRMLSPIVAVSLASWYCLPETTGNIIKLLKQYEEKVPIVWETDQSVSKDIQKFKEEGVKEVEHITDKLGIKK